MFDQQGFRFLKIASRFTPWSRQTIVGLTVALATIASCLSTTAVTAEVKWRYKLYLAVPDGDGHKRVKKHTFGCEDTIYLFFETADERLFGQSLGVKWENLANRIVHETTKPLEPKNSGNRHWSWSGIAFQAGYSSPLERITGFLDPAVGKEQFIGDWVITATVGEGFREQLEMTVLC